MQKSEIMQAYEHCEKVRHFLNAAGRRMEVIEDKAGVVCLRYLVGRKPISVILFGTPSWYNLFIEMPLAGTHDEIIEKLKEF